MKKWLNTEYYPIIYSCREVRKEDVHLYDCFIDAASELARPVHVLQIRPNKSKSTGVSVCKSSAMDTWTDAKIHFLQSRKITSATHLSCFCRLFYLDEKKHNTEDRSWTHTHSHIGVHGN